MCPIHMQHNLSDNHLSPTHLQLNLSDSHFSPTHLQLTSPTQSMALRPFLSTRCLGTVGTWYSGTTWCLGSMVTMGTWCVGAMGTKSLGTMDTWWLPWNHVLVRQTFTKNNCTLTLSMVLTKFRFPSLWLNSMHQCNLQL